MERRRFLKIGAIGGAGMAMEINSNLPVASAQPARVITVNGPIAAEEMGTTLPHEHIMVDFIGADKVSKDRYNADEVFEVALPHLKQLKGLGCKTLVECTPAYIGRDAGLMRRLSQASGLHILTNTGWYGAANDKFLPPRAFVDDADRIAARWLKEWEQGIDDTGIKPGFIKIGVDAGPLSEVDAKLVRAAAKCHLMTGLTIAAHTGNGVAAMEELKVLQEEGVSPSAFIWVHAQNESNTMLHLQAAQMGAWVEFDGINEQSVKRHVQLVKTMHQRELLGRVLVSHDAGWYHVGESRGGTYRPYDTLFTRFLPELRAVGMSEGEIQKLVGENPRSAFAVRVRKLKLV